MGFLRLVLVLLCCRPTLCQVAGEERTDCSIFFIIILNLFYTIGVTYFFNMHVFSLFFSEKKIVLTYKTGRITGSSLIIWAKNVQHLNLLYSKGL